MTKLNNQRPVPSRKSSRLTLKGSAFFTLQYLILAWLAPAYVLSQLPSTSSPPAAILAVLQVSSVALAWNGASRNGWTRLVDSSFWLFVYVFFGVAPLVQRAANSLPWGAAQFPDPIWLITDGLILLGCLAYVAGRFVYSMIRQRSRFVLAKQRILAWGLPLLLLSVAVFGFAYGWTGFVMHRSARSAAILLAGGSTAVSQVLSSIITTPLVVLLPALLLLRGKVGGGARILHWVSLSAAVVVTFAIINFYSAPRFLAGTTLLSAGVAYVLLLRQRRVWLKLLPLAFAVGLMAAFPLSAMFRRGSATVSLEVTPMVESLATSGDFDAYLQFARSVDYVTHSGDMGGMNLVAASAFWVPRLAWPAKPPHSGEILAGYANQAYLNLSAPLWAEGMLAFGIPGLVLLLFSWGVFAGSVDYALLMDVRRGDGVFSASALLATILLGFSVFFLRGALMNGVAMLTPIVVLSILLSRPFAARKGLGQEVRSS